VTFQPGASVAAARTVVVKFASGAHGDAYPFDGPGGVLAHTFYPVPVNPETIAGDMHLDADEAWHVGSDIAIYSVALHEAGHAVVAGLLGWYVGHVVIGWGRPVARFRWGKTRIEIRALPVEGFVRTVPTNLSCPRLKSALIYFAGPGVELLLLGILLAAVGPSTLLTLSPSYPLLAAQSLALAILVSTFINLVPHSVVSASGPIANDGLGILSSFFVPEEHFADMIRSRDNDNDDRWEEKNPAD